MNKISISLVPFLVFSLIAVLLTNYFTKEDIAKQKEKVLNDKLVALFETEVGRKIEAHIVLTTPPLMADNNGEFDDKNHENSNKKSTIWLVCENFQRIGVIFPIRTVNGYAGNIDLLVGIDKQGKVVGVDVLSHQETPGLGDKIEPRKSVWLAQFKNKDMSYTWSASRGKTAVDYDAMTATTVTANAVMVLLKEALQTFDTIVLPTCLNGSSPR